MSWLPHHTIRTLSHAVIDAQVAIHQLSWPPEEREEVVRKTDWAMARLCLAHTRLTTRNALRDLDDALAIALDRCHVLGQPSDPGLWRLHRLLVACRERCAPAWAPRCPRRLPTGALSG